MSSNTCLLGALRGDSILGAIEQVAPEVLERPETREMFHTLSSVALPQVGEFRNIYEKSAGSRSVSEEEFARRAARDLTAVGFDFGWFHVKGKLGTWETHAQRVAPGTYLRRLVERHQTQAGRAPKPSDTADLEHVLALPYMDVSTVDRENHGVVMQHWGKIARPRNGVVISNPTQLAGLIAAVRAIPE